MAKNEAKIKFTAATGEFNKAIGQAENTLSELRAELKLNETQMKATGTTVEGLENKHSILQKQYDASRSKSEALSQKLQKAVELYGENSNEVSRLRVQLTNAQTAEEKYRQAVEQCANELKEQKSASESVENASETLTEKISRQEAELKRLKAAYVNAVSDYGETSDEARNLGNQIETLSKDLNKNRTAFKNASDQADAFDKSLDGAGDASDEAKSATDRLTDQIEKQQSELNKLKSDYSSAVLEHGKYSSEARKLAKQIDALSDELNTNKKKLGEVEAAADNLDNSLDDVGETAEKASEGFSVMKGAMADLVADGIEKLADGLMDVGKEAFTMANDIDKATNTFIAKTGVSQGSAKAFEDVMTSIYNGNYGESFEDIADSMATVKTALGDLSTDDLERITTDALILRDTFDMDVNESILAVNSMMDQFGITADEAYSLIAQGAQKGLNQNGDLLDVVNEYSAQFKDAGYSAEDMFNMLANGVEAGTWSVDKLGDAVKEFNIRASDGTVGEAIKENAKAFGMTAQEAKALASEVESGSVGAYQKLADKLRAVDDDTKRYQMGVELFGTMWEDLGEEAVLALLDTQGQISSTKDTLSEINSVKYDDLGSAFEGIKRNLQTSVSEPIKNEVMPAVNDFVENVDWEGVGQTIGEVMGVAVDAVFSLVEGTQQAVQWMNEHKGVLTAVGIAVGIVATAIGAYNVVQGIKTAMDAAQVTTIWGLVAAHWAQATAAMAAIAPYVLVVAAIAAVIAIIVLCVKYWDEIVAAVKWAWDSIVSILSQWGEWIYNNVIQPIISFFSGLWDGIVSIFSAVGDWFSEKFQAAKDGIVNAWSSVTGFFGEKWSGIKDTFADVGGWFSEKFQNGKEKAVDAWSDVKTKFSGVWKKTQSAFSDAGDWFSDKFATGKKNAVDAWSDAKTKFSGVWDKTQSAFSKVGSFFSEEFKDGKNNAVKAWSDSKSKFSGVWNKTKSAFSKVGSFFKTTFSTAKNNSVNAFSNIKSLFSGVVSKIRSAFSNVKSILTKPFQEAKDAIKAVVDKVKGFFNVQIRWPHIPTPHFSVSPPGWKIGDLLKGEIPRLSISWYKDGGIFTKPTIFNTPYGLKGVGEAGAEAVLPIDRLEGYIERAIEKSQNVVNLEPLAAAIEDLANRPNNLYINSRRFAYATAGDGDRVNGLRTNFKNRGLEID